MADCPTALILAGFFHDRRHTCAKPLANAASTSYRMSVWQRAISEVVCSLLRAPEYILTCIIVCTLRARPNERILNTEGLLSGADPGYCRGGSIRCKVIFAYARNYRLLLFHSSMRVVAVLHYLL